MSFTVTLHGADQRIIAINEYHGDDLVFHRLVNDGDALMSWVYQVPVVGGMTSAKMDPLPKNWIIV